MVTISSLSGELLIYDGPIAVPASGNAGLTASHPYPKRPPKTLVIVILLISIITLTWQLISSWKTQQALQWWYSRQEYQRHQAAEEIRNGLLQKAFALRRNLEVTQPSPGIPSPAQPQIWLNTLEELNHDLNRLSDRLSPLYPEDSLPLALHARVEQWRSAYPHCQFTLDLPAQWPTEPYSRRQTIIAVLDELFHLALSQPTAALGVAIHLRPEQQDHGSLDVEIQTPNFSSSDFKNQISQLARIFTVLGAGRYIYRYRKNCFSSDFSWRLQPDS